MEFRGESFLGGLTQRLFDELAGRAATGSIKSERLDERLTRGADDDFNERHGWKPWYER